jgi:cell division protein FtsQ
MEKIRRFVTVYDTHLSHVWTDVKAVDVRYTNGVAVRWVAESAMAKKYIKSQTQAALPTSATTKILRINRLRKSPVTWKLAPYWQTRFIEWQTLATTK